MQTSDQDAAAAKAERAASLGLADYQLDIYDTLLAQEDRAIPREVLPILARWLDSIDFGPLLVGRQEAAKITQTSIRTVSYMVGRHPQWMRPLVEPTSGDGVTPLIQLWLEAKVRAYSRWRLASRQLEDGEGDD